MTADEHDEQHTMKAFMQAQPQMCGAAHLETCQDSAVSAHALLCSGACEDSLHLGLAAAVGHCSVGGQVSFSHFLATAKFLAS